MTVSVEQEQTPYDNLQFTYGLYTNENDVKQWNDIKHIINKKNPLYEITTENKNICVYIDIDGRANPDIKQTDFENNVHNVNEVFKGFEDDFVFMTASKYNHVEISKKGEEVKKHKYSWRLTYKRHINCISKMAKYVEKHIYPHLKDVLVGTMDLTYGKDDDIKYDYLNIDPVVYRLGFGKMRTINAYKHKNIYELERTNTMVNGDIEDHLIHFIKDSYEYVELDDNYITYEEPKTKKNKTTKKVVLKPTTTTKEPISKKTVKIEQRIMNDEAPKRSQMQDLLMNYLGNDKQDWNRYFLVGSTLAHNGYDFDLFDKWCDLLEDNDETEDNLKLWNSAVKSSKYMNVGGIINLLKKTKPQMYEEYLSKYHVNKDPRITLDMVNSPCEMITHLRPFLFHFIRFVKKDWWYVYCERTGLWERKVNIKMTLVNYIRKLVKNEIKMLQKNKKTEVSDSDSDSDSDDEEEKEKQNKQKKLLKKWKKALDTVEKKQSIYQTYCETDLVDYKFEERLDRCKGFLAYRNGLYDIENDILRDICYDNYITTTLPYDYEKGNAKDKEYVKSQLMKICNMDKDLLEYYLSIYGYALTGYADAVQQFWVFYGANGSNGKSLPLDILSDILGHYVYAGNSKMLDKQNAKSHKSLPSVTRARIAWFNELPSQTALNNPLIKCLRDGTCIANEVMFGTEIMLQVNCKMIIVSNHEVKFGKDGGMNRSMRQLHFKSTFYDKETLKQEDPSNLHFHKDTEVPKTLRNMKHSFIELLLDYARDFMKNGMKEEPLCVKEETQNAIKDNDGFYNWLDTRYVKEVGHYTSVEDIMSIYPQRNNFDQLELRKYILKEMRRLSMYIFKKEKRIGDYRGAFIDMRRKTSWEMEQQLKGECLVNVEDEDDVFNV